jgi:hypothetical protein
VVNPIWLFTITWIVPPVRQNGSSDRFSVSNTTPCPVNAASPVQQDRDDLAWSLSPADLLLGPDDPLDDRVDQLEVARVRAEAQVDGLVAAGTGRSLAYPRWYLTSPVALPLLVDVRVLELAEDHLVRLVQHVGQHAEPAAVGMPTHTSSAPSPAPVVDQRVHQRDQRLGPLEAERLGPLEARRRNRSNSSAATSWNSTRPGLLGDMLGRFRPAPSAGQPLPLGLVEMFWNSTPSDRQ